jgi:hypothetical protein
MVWNNSIKLLATRSRRSAIATALMYAVSVTIRFTSATGAS